MVTAQWKKLYVDIRRLHRKLPPALKYIGNGYIRSEFRLHKTAKDQHLQSFLQAWSQYGSDLKQQLDDTKIESIGKKIDHSILESFNPSQLGQLLALRETSKDKSKSK